jgi:hypothetical protein
VTTSRRLDHLQEEEAERKTREQEEAEQWKKEGVEQWRNEEAEQREEAGRRLADVYGAWEYVECDVEDAAEVGGVFAVAYRAQAVTQLASLVSEFVFGAPLSLHASASSTPAPVVLEHTLLLRDLIHHYARHQDAIQLVGEPSGGVVAV